MYSPYADRELTPERRHFLVGNLALDIAELAMNLDNCLEQYYEQKEEHWYEHYDTHHAHARADPIPQNADPVVPEFDTFSVLQILRVAQFLVAVYKSIIFFYTDLNWFHLYFYPMHALGLLIALALDMDSSDSIVVMNRWDRFYDL